VQRHGERVEDLIAVRFVLALGDQAACKDQLRRPDHLARRIAAAREAGLVRRGGVHLGRDRESEQ